MNNLPVYCLHDLMLADKGQTRYVKLLTYEVLHNDFNIQLVSIDSANMGLLFPIRGCVMLAIVNTIWSGMPDLILKWCRELKSESEEERLLQCLAYINDVEIGVMVSKDCFSPLRPMTFWEAESFVSCLGY
mmetsp:Transcript_8720/g.17020  ORF Transcript_8720/g.17020 Transcript_8720/m.17020 type:complete len:131 (-) Transcript_8720:447-839(-)